VRRTGDFITEVTEDTEGTEELIHRIRIDTGTGVGSHEADLAHSSAPSVSSVTSVMKSPAH
jgi:hypothetical protein